MTINIENINKTIDLIRFEGALAFSMETFGNTNYNIFNAYDTTDELIKNHCGTAACIAGFAYTSKTGRPINSIDDVSVSISTVAREFLGLDYDSSYELFFPDSVENGYTATRAQAIKVLEHLRDTGKVDWTVAGFVADPSYEIDEEDTDFDD